MLQAGSSHSLSADPRSLGSHAAAAPCCDELSECHEDGGCQKGLAPTGIVSPKTQGAVRGREQAVAGRTSALHLEGARDGPKDHSSVLRSRGVTTLWRTSQPNPAVPPSPTQLLPFLGICMSCMESIWEPLDPDLHSFLTNGSTSESCLFNVKCDIFKK